MSGGITEEKNLIRSFIKDRKTKYPIEWKIENSDIIFKKIEDTGMFCKSKTILLYNALPDEVQTISYIKKWAETKKIILPVVNGSVLELREYCESSMQQGAFGIYEPKGTKIVKPEEIDLAVVPGVAFDRSCRRLGRGKGYYDRALEGIKAYVVGIGFSFQIVDRVPTEQHDRILDYVITEKDTFKLI